MKKFLKKYPFPISMDKPTEKILDELIDPATRRQSEYIRKLIENDHKNGGVIAKQMTSEVMKC